MYAPSWSPPPGATVYGPAPSRVAAPAPAPRRPAPTAQAAAPAPKPTFRAAPPDETPSRPAPLVMPSPERLGVGLPRPPTLDATTIARRLQQLGASGYHLDRLPEGGFRFTCWIPTAQPGVSNRIEATAASESEAARLALEKAAQTNAR
jgi:hypothetical protein